MCCLTIHFGSNHQPSKVDSLQTNASRMQQQELLVPSALFFQNNCKALLMIERKILIKVIFSIWSNNTEIFSCHMSASPIQDNQLPELKWNFSHGILITCRICGSIVKCQNITVKHAKIKFMARFRENCLICDCSMTLGWHNDLGLTTRVSGRLAWTNKHYRQCLLKISTFTGQINV